MTARPRPRQLDRLPRVMYHGSFTEFHGPATVMPIIGWCCAACRAERITHPGLILQTDTGHTLRHVRRCSVTVLSEQD